MLETREWVAVILTAVIVTFVAVAVGTLLNIGFLTAGGWLVGVVAGVVIAFSISRRGKD